MENSLGGDSKSKNASNKNADNNNASNVNPNSNNASNVNPDNNNNASNVNPNSNNASNVNPDNNNNASNVNPDNNNNASNVNLDNNNASSVNRDSNNASSVNPDNNNASNINRDSNNASSVNLDNNNASNINRDSKNASSVNPNSNNASNVNPDSNNASNVNLDSNKASDVNLDSYTTSTTTPSATPSPPPLESDTSLPGFHPVIFPPQILEQLRRNVVSLGKVTLIGHVAGENPLLEEIQTWVDTYLINPTLYPEIQIHQISLITQGYFTLTFTTKEGADKAFSLSPIDCNHHLMFLHAWTPNFSPPPGEASLIWVLFPELPRIYYPYLEYIANTIGRVVWQSEKATNIQKGFPPKIRVLVEDVRVLPGSISIPLASEGGWFDQRVSYEGISNQICGKCKNLTIATDSID